MARNARKVTRKGSVVAAPKKGLVVRSAESSRMTGMRSIPLKDRDAAVREFLKNAK